MDATAYGVQPVFFVKSGASPESKQGRVDGGLAWVIPPLARIPPPPSPAFLRCGWLPSTAGQGGARTAPALPNRGLRVAVPVGFPHIPVRIRHRAVPEAAVDAGTGLLTACMPMPPSEIAACGCGGESSSRMRGGACWLRTHTPETLATVSRKTAEKRNIFRCVT